MDGWITNREGLLIHSFAASSAWTAAAGDELWIAIEGYANRHDVHNNRRWMPIVGNLLMSF